jgi:hypothetical protein
VLRVAVLTIEDALPELDFSSPGDLFFIKQDDIISVDVALGLMISESMLYDVLDLCVKVSIWMTIMIIELIIEKEINENELNHMQPC